MYTYMYLILILNHISSALSYGALGHYVIGEVVQRTMTPESFEYFEKCKYLEPFNGSLGIASVYPDVLKRNPKYRWTSPFHYYDIDNDPPQECGLFQPPESSRTINLYNGIGRALRNATSCTKKERLEDGTCCASFFHTSMLWHLLQDMYQPLHLTGKARGGNDVYFKIGHKKYNLHRFWDTYALELLMTEKVGENYTREDTVTYFCNKMEHVQLPESSCYNVTNDVEGINGYIFSKAQHILDENCLLIWNTEDDDYVEKSKMLLENLIVNSIQITNCVIHKLSMASR